jgi:hypothetical protein
MLYPYGSHALAFSSFGAGYAQDAHLKAPNCQHGLANGQNAMQARPSSDQSPGSGADPRRRFVVCGDEVHGWRAQKTCHVLGGWVFEQFQGAPRCSMRPSRMRTMRSASVMASDLVIGDINYGFAQVLVQAFDFTAHLVTQLRVQVRQRFVKEVELLALRTTARPMATRCN